MNEQKAWHGVGGWGELDRCQPEGDNCFVVPLHLSFSHSLLRLLLSVPNLVWCQTTRLGNSDREEQDVRRREWQEKTGSRMRRKKKKIGLHHSFIPSITLFLSALLSRVLIITRFCVTGLNKALPCLDYFLPASVDVHAFAGFNHN